MEENTDDAASERDRFYTKEKVAVNTAVREMLELLYRPGDHVCVLDTSTAHSIGMLSSVVRDPRCLSVPNPDGTIFDDMLPIMRAKCTTHVMTAGDYMRSQFAWPGSHHHWWLDYCCTLPTAEPDIRFLLGKLNECPPQRPVLLALTFSVRGIAGGSEATTDMLASMSKDYPALLVSGVETLTYRSMVFVSATVSAASQKAMIAIPVPIDQQRERCQQSPPSQPDFSECRRVRRHRRRPRKPADRYVSLNLPGHSGVLTARFMDEHEACLPAYAHLTEDGVCYAPKSPGRLSKYLGICRSSFGVLAYQIDPVNGMVCGVPSANMQPNIIVWVSLD